MTNTMTAEAMENLAVELALRYGRPIDVARKALRNAMCDIARCVGMPEVKIQAHRAACRRRGAL